MTLTDFLLARIAEDEAVAEHLQAEGTAIEGGRVLRGPVAHAGHSDDAGPGPADRWNPARVLAECEAKRRIVVLAFEATGLDQTVDMERETGSRHDSGVHYVGDRILRAMAAVYGDHADFAPAWRS